MKQVDLRRAALRTTLAVAAAFLSAAPVQAVNAWDSVASFQASFAARDFAGIEARYDAIVRTGELSDESIPLVEAYASFTNVEACYQPVNVVRGWTPARCDEHFRAIMTAWQAAFPASRLPAIGLAAIDVAHARWVRTSEAERDALLARGWELLQRVPLAQRSLIWYVNAFDVAEVEGWGPRRFEALYEEGRERFGRFTSYHQRAARYYAPSYGGSVVSFEQFARRAAERAGGDRALVYAKIYDTFATNAGEPAGWVYLHSRMDWPLMREGLQAMFRRHPVAFYRDRIALHACLAGDLETMRWALAQVTGPGISGWLGSEEEQCRRLLNRDPKPAAPRAVAAAALPAQP